ncbi:MAG: DUF192 domain-containing protein [Candidatus Woesearchaeota archaeon]
MKKVKIKVDWYADNLWKWTKGLMFSKPKVVFFDFKKIGYVSIHMFFVFFPIYAVVLDEKYKVIKIKKLYPFISFFSFKSKYLIEIPESIFKKYKIKEGDELELS